MFASYLFRSRVEVVEWRRPGSRTPRACNDHHEEIEVVSNRIPLMWLLCSIAAFCWRKNPPKTHIDSLFLLVLLSNMKFCLSKIWRFDEKTWKHPHIMTSPDWRKSIKTKSFYMWLKDGSVNFTTSVWNSIISTENWKMIFYSRSNYMECSLRPALIFQYDSA